MSLRTIGLGLLGLAVAASLGLAGYVVAGDTFALPATSLPAGGDLAPAPTARQAAPRPAATTERGPATTGEDEEREREDEDRSGPGGGGSGNSGPGGGGSGSGSGGNSGPGGGDD
jgi:hypothetical protein